MLCAKICSNLFFTVCMKTNNLVKFSSNCNSDAKIISEMTQAVFLVDKCTTNENPGNSTLDKQYNQYS